MLVEQLVDGRHYLRLGPTQLPRPAWERQLQCMSCTTTKADVRSQSISTQECDVFDKQPRQALAFTRWRAGISPQAGKIGRKVQDGFAVVRIQYALRFRLLTLVQVLGLD